MRILMMLWMLVGVPWGAYANDSFNSEFSHVAGSSVMAAGFTLVADRYLASPEPAWVGFGLATSVGVVGETASWCSGGHFSWLDLGSDALGAALGAYASQRWWLRPESDSRNHYLGLTAGYRF